MGIQDDPVSALFSLCWSGGDDGRHSLNAVLTLLVWWEYRMTRSQRCSHSACLVEIQDDTVSTLYSFCWSVGDTGRHGLNAVLTLLVWWGHRTTRSQRCTHSTGLVGIQDDPVSALYSLCWSGCLVHRMWTKLKHVRPAYYWPRTLNIPAQLEIAE